MFPKSRRNWYIVLAVFLLILIKITNEKFINVGKSHNANFSSPDNKSMGIDKLNKNTTDKNHLTELDSARNNKNGKTNTQLTSLEADHKFVLKFKTAEFGVKSATFSFSISNKINSNPFNKPICSIEYLKLGSEKNRTSFTDCDKSITIYNLEPNQIYTFYPILTDSKRRLETTNITSKITKRIFDLPDTIYVDFIRPTQLHYKIKFNQANQPKSCRFYRIDYLKKSKKADPLKCSKPDDNQNEKKGAQNKSSKKYQDMQRLTEQNRLINIKDTDIHSIDKKNIDKKNMLKFGFIDKKEAMTKLFVEKFLQKLNLIRNIQNLYRTNYSKKNDIDKIVGVKFPKININMCSCSESLVDLPNDLKRYDFIIITDSMNNVISDRIQLSKVINQNKTTKNTNTATTPNNIDPTTINNETTINKYTESPDENFININITRGQIDAKTITIVESVEDNNINIDTHNNITSDNNDFLDNNSMMNSNNENFDNDKNLNDDGPIMIPKSNDSKENRISSDNSFKDNMHSSSDNPNVAEKSDNDSDGSNNHGIDKPIKTNDDKSQNRYNNDQTANQTVNHNENAKININKQDIDNSIQDNGKKNSINPGVTIVSHDQWNNNNMDESKDDNSTIDINDSNKDGKNNLMNNLNKKKQHHQLTRKEITALALGVTAASFTIYLIVTLNIDKKYIYFQRH